VTLPTLVLLLLSLELAFRFVIPAREDPYVYWDPQEKILKHERIPSRGLWTAGVLAQQKAEWRVNNLGWISDRDYEAGKREKLLIAIIGDSYIQAVQVGPDKNVAAVLRRMLNGRAEVYSFASAGFALGEYLQLSRYIARHFRPQVLVFNIVHNDLPDAVCGTMSRPGGLCFKETLRGIEEVPGAPYVPSTCARIARKFALVRYVKLNVGFYNILAGVSFWGRKGFSANTDLKPALEKKKVIAKVLDHFFARLVDENPGTHIVAMMDAPRPAIYLGDLPEREIVWENELVGKTCLRYSVPFIDLTGPMGTSFQKSGQKLGAAIFCHGSSGLEQLLIVDFC